jgi:hypothetical protein
MFTDPHRDIYTNLIKFLPNSELCSMLKNKANLLGSSHSKSNKFNDVSVLRASSQSASLKGLYAALLILTRTLHECSLLENAGAYSPE